MADLSFQDWRLPLSSRSCRERPTAREYPETAILDLDLYQQLVAIAEAPFAPPNKLPGTHYCHLAR